MTKSNCQRALYSLAAVLFGITANGIAQEAGLTIAVQAPGCSGVAGCAGPQPSVTMMGGPVIGAGPLGVVSTGGMGFALPENVEVVKNQPYMAQAITEIKQTLADGTHIAQTTTATVARDGEGKTVRIQKLSTIGPWKSSSDSSQGDSPTLTTIFDPVAKTHTDFTSDSKVAHVLSMPPPPPLPPGAVTTGANGGFAVFAGGPVSSGAGPMTFSVQGHAGSAQATAGPNIQTESLGTKTIDGIVVTGTKTTNTIPAGMIGNDKDIVITRETWYSADLKLVLQSTQIDPRFGETAYSLTQIQRSEPDPTLFQIPSGYRIEKVPVHVQAR